MQEDKRFLFERMPVSQAILRLAVPTVMTQIILVIYNMADTFFIGLAGRDVSVAAVTICMPAFLFLSAAANLFGVGGSSTISRALGSGRTRRAENASGLALYGCILLTALYSLAAYVFRMPFIRALGGIHPAVAREAIRYLTITVAAGGLFTSLASMLAYLVRAEGRSFHASLGMMIGGVLNIVLDPLFMFVLMPAGQEVTAVALATLCSNMVSFFYYVFYIRACRHRYHSILTFQIHFDDDLSSCAREILSTGLPACIMTLCENISYAVLDAITAKAGLAFQAGIGVAKKVNMISHSIVRGMSQGVLPLIAYNYSRRNYQRMKQVLRTSMTMSISLSLAAMTVSLVFSRQLISIFLASPESIAAGAVYLRILCLGGPFSAFAYAVISFFQAVGEGKKSFQLALLRKGVVDIPLMFLFSAVNPVYGAVAATPTTDVICFLRAISMLKGHVSCLIEGENRLHFR